MLTIAPPAAGNYGVEISVTIPNSGDDWDLTGACPCGS